MRLCIIAILTVLSFPAVAQGACGPRTEVIKALADEYQEVPVARGIENTGRVLEVIATSNGRTWTLIITDVHGMACVVSTGEAWESIPIIRKSGYKA